MHRPTYHFQPLKNWMNDPNGPIWFKDRLHMFYQHNPYEPVWGNMSWGHATTKDLVHWEHLPVALEPTPGSYDKDGIFSGCSVEKDGVPYILYTGVGPEVQCLAIGNEDATEYKKYEGNPIIVRPEGAELTGYRDPFVIREDNGYTLLIGSGYAKEGGTALTYRSRDLIHWEYTGELCRGKYAESDDMWECPNFVKGPNGRAILMVSTMSKFEVLAMEGRYENLRFTPGKPRRYDLGDCFYAPNVTILPDGRTVQWGWMRETAPGEKRAQSGWQGMLTLPRQISFDGDGFACVRPVAEVEKLRAEMLLQKRSFTLHDSENPLKGIRGRHLEIDIDMECGASSLVLEMLRAEKGREQVQMRYDGAEDSIFVDLSRSGEDGKAQPVGGYVQGQPRTSLRIFIDGSAIEIYINNRETLTTRAYPTLADSDGLRLFAEGSVRISNLRVYRMES